MTDEASVCAALLHDVAEDTDITLEDLGRQGIPSEVVETVRLLTHEESVPYMDYVRNIKAGNNPTAIAVKLADLRHNSDPSRMGGVEVEGKAAKRRDRYLAAIGLLGGA